MSSLLPLVLILLSFNCLAHQASGSLGGGIATGAPVATTATPAEIAEILGNPSSSPAKLRFFSNPTMMHLQVNEIPDDALKMVEDLSKCDQRQINEQCSVVQPALPKDYLDFLMSYSTYKPLDGAPTNIPGVRAVVQTNCECLRDKLKGNTSSEVFGKQVDDQKKIVNEKIIDALGRKFVNDFSSNIEDVSFFLTKTKDMFSDEEVAKGLQCNDQSLYNSKIDEVCNGKGIRDVQFIKARKDKLINILNGANIAFEDRLGTMSREIMSARITSDLKDTNGQVYARENYDSLRLSLATYDPQAIFMSNLAGKMFRDKFFTDKIREAMFGDRTPVEAIIKVINENRSKPEFANLGLSSQDVNSYLKDPATTVSSFKFMMKIHPGFFQSMKDKKVFNNLQSAFNKSANANLLDLLAKDKTILEPVLVENCKKMIADFANAVCTIDEDLISNMDPVDLTRLLHADDKATPPGTVKQPVLSDLLVCQAKVSSVPKDQRFKELANLIDTRLRSSASDYYERTVSSASGGPSTDAFSGAGTFSASPNGNHIARILTDHGNKLSSRVSAGGVVSTQVYAENVVSGKDLGVGSGSMSREEARKYLAQSKVYDETKASQKMASANSNKVSSQVASSTNEGKETPVKTDSAQGVPAVAATNSNTPVPQYVSNDSYNRTAAQSREALRQYMEDKNSGAFAQEAVSRLDDPSAIEMDRLRNENLALLEKTLKFETEKFEDMKKKIAELEKTSAPVATKITQEKKSSEDQPTLQNSRRSLPSSSNFAKNSFQGSSRSIASVSGKFSTQNSSTVSKTEPVTNGRGNKTVTEEPLIRSSLTVKAIPGKASEIVPQELKVEVQKLLDSPSINISSLEEIKTKGFLYRYSVVENDEIVQKEVLVKFDSLDKATRDAIELKLTRKAAEHQVSKLAVLKLLISKR